MHPIFQFCNSKVVKMSSSERVNSRAKMKLAMLAFLLYCGEFMEKSQRRVVICISLTPNKTLNLKNLLFRSTTFEN